MKRVFVAIDISEKARRAAAARIAAFKSGQPIASVKWVQPENLHLTVRFIGDVDNEQLSSIAASVENAARTIPPFMLRLQRPGVFPSPKKARVLWIGVEEEQRMAGRLRDMMEVELSRLGIPGDDKSFKPHLTIGRVKDPRQAEPLIRKHLEVEFEPIEFEVGEVVIYESKLMPAGAVYSKLVGISLRQNT